MGKLRTFSPQFKREVVQQIVNGHKSRAQVCQEHQLAPRVVGRWKTAYLQHGEQAFTNRRCLADELSLERQVAELQRVCGRLELENELLKKALGKSRLRLLSGTE